MNTEAIPVASAPCVTVKLEESCIPDIWNVTISVGDGRFRPTEGQEWICRREGRLMFCGPDAKRDAEDAAEQLTFAMKPLAQVVPLDDVDSLLSGIARQVGATQLSSGHNANFAGVVRSYIRDGAWRTMHDRTTLAEQKAARLEADNQSLRSRVAELEQRQHRLAIRAVKRERCIWKIHEPLGESVGGQTACDNIIAELEAMAKSTP